MTHLPDLSLSRLGDDTPAGLWIASLPWPRTAGRGLSLNGQPTYTKALGQWPGEAEGSPRRLLLIADGGDSAPEQLSLTEAGGTPAPRDSSTASPTAAMELFARCEEEGLMWERHLLRLTHGGKSIGIAMGLRHARAGCPRSQGEVHWWEACRLVVVEETPTCRVIEMGGAIPRLPFLKDECLGCGYDYPLLHKHNWLNGRVFARLHSNGVCEIFAHHINSRFFDDGEDLADVVPVIGFAVDGDMTEVGEKELTGEAPFAELGGVKFDLTEPARLATAEQPGRVEFVPFDGNGVLTPTPLPRADASVRFSGEGNGNGDGFVVWQPYAGVEVFSGSWARQMLGDPFIWHAEDRLFPRGMARTLRFSLSLSDRSPRVARYLPPAWWYGACEELLPEPLLPVSNAYDQTLDACREYCRRFIVRGGFEDGALPRGGNPNPPPEDKGRSEAGWEGEAPWAMFLLAYLSGAAEDYEDALRAAWHFTDIAVDHAAKLVRMHGFGTHAFAEPMNRVLGPITAYLETGVPYLIEAAQAVVDNAHWLQKNSWPRLAVGRDGKYVRGATILYRVLADEHYRQIAREGALIVAQSQRDNGSFGDQAGGSGIHQWGCYITKPWMALMATEGVLDYLELFPDDEPLLECIRRTADWLMEARFDHKGVMGWSYQHDFDGQPQHLDLHSGRFLQLCTPEEGMFHQNSLGRLLGYCAMRFGQPEYLDAWAESYAANPGASGDHGVVTSGHPIPWLQAKLWNARLTAEGLSVSPVHFGPRTEAAAKIMTPEGEVAVAWGADGKVTPPAGVSIR
jgi:hypothetical protein